MQDIRQICICPVTFCKYILRKQRVLRNRSKNIWIKTCILRWCSDTWGNNKTRASQLFHAMRGICYASLFFCPIFTTLLRRIFHFVLLLSHKFPHSTLSIFVWQKHSSTTMCIKFIKKYWMNCVKKDSLSAGFQ